MDNFLIVLEITVALFFKVGFYYYFDTILQHFSLLDMRASIFNIYQYSWSLLHIISYYFLVTLK